IERGDLVAVAMLAILKAGKVCVPLHPVNREARALEHVINDLAPSLILSDKGGAALAESMIEKVAVVNVETADFNGKPDSDPGMASKPEELAFILYTSGSTGEPKGVMHSHRNILSRIVLYQRNFGFGLDDRAIMMASVDHVSGIMGIFRPLVTSGCVVVYDLRAQGFEALEQNLEEQQVTVLTTVNSVFRSFIAGLSPETRFPHVRLLILTSEAMTVSDVESYRRHFSDECLLLNTFGSTELPTYRQFVLRKDTLLPGGKVPVGHAVTGVDVSIVDDDGHPLPAGQPGEIITHSLYLALGYWNRPEENEARFFKDENGIPSCRTGDIGCLDEDGILDFQGRKDWQVKILGNRVELGEIEQVLAYHPGVQAVALKAFGNSTVSPRLCAYVVTNESGASIPALKAHVREHLPDYMVPSYFVYLEALPLTGSGKVNRRALPDPPVAFHKEVSDSESVFASELEQQISGICQEVLQLDSLEPDASFFDFGIDSLKVMRMVNRLNKQFSINMSVATPLSYSSVTQLADCVKKIKVEC
ncbi:MAG: AMP-binding protein, partial [Verrucomicrobiae bacterium]|nr:AMP-binding protein [Verrucomicrobiae bacterium]